MHILYVSTDPFRNSYPLSLPNANKLGLDGFAWSEALIAGVIWPDSRAMRSIYYRPAYGFPDSQKKVPAVSSLVLFP